MVKPFIFQVVGFQNSGKTTFMNSLIKRIRLKNYEVGTIKHHGHGGKPEINEEKDAAKHIQSGAKVSIVEGDGRLLLQAEKSCWTLEEQIQIMLSFGLDLLLIEGHKYADYPKVFIIKNEEDLILINELTNIQVILFRDEIVFPKGLTIPTFKLNSEESYNWVVQYLERKVIRPE
ncbi:MAG TPA: molybdopterin-guanine dinucleotide biosynthesis protein B [Pseudoneobacillus sp.]|nr:molybdopterin-guanine dinucleotide biosynthesis protein B [Pseudoneobacillus sp.]